MSKTKGKSFSVRFEDLEKHASITQRFKTYKDNMKGDPVSSIVLETIFDLADGINLKDKFSHTLQSVQDIIENVNCEFLIYDGIFYCSELVHKTKKNKSLGSSNEESLGLCRSCQLGKALKILNEYQKKLRGKNIKGLLQMITTFERFASSGVPSPIYFCNRIPEEQRFTGLKTMYCSRLRKDISITPTCTDPRCQYFEDYIVQVHQDFPAQTLELIENISEDFKRIEDLTSKKTVDVEQIVPDKQGEPDI